MSKIDNSKIVNKVSMQPHKRERVNLAEIDKIPETIPRRRDFTQNNASTVSENLENKKESLQEKLSNQEIEIKELKEKYETLINSDSDKKIFKIDTRDIKQGKTPNRLKSYFISKNFKAFVNNIKNEGQLTPVMLRKNPEEGVEKWEIVFGHKRVEACRELGIPVFAMIENTDERQTQIRAFVENYIRDTPSDYELALRIERCLESKIFNNQEEVGLIFNMSQSNVSRILKLTKLPNEIVGLFEDTSYLSRNNLKDYLSISKNYEKRIFINKNVDILFDDNLNDDQRLEFISDFELFVVLYKMVKNNPQGEIVSLLDEARKLRELNKLNELKKEESEKEKLTNEIKKMDVVRNPKYEIRAGQIKIGNYSYDKQGNVKFNISSEHSDFAEFLIRRIQILEEEFKKNKRDEFN